jgi:hypothetical protein
MEYFPCRMIDDMKHLTRSNQVNYHRSGMCNMINIVGIQTREEDFLNVMRFGVPAESGLWRCDTLLSGKWF